MSQPCHTKNALNSLPLPCTQITFTCYLPPTVPSIVKIPLEASKTTWHPGTRGIWWESIGRNGNRLTVHGKFGWCWRVWFGKSGFSRVNSPFALIQQEVTAPGHGLYLSLSVWKVLLWLHPCEIKSEQSLPSACSDTHLLTSTWLQVSCEIWPHSNAVTLSKWTALSLSFQL